MEFSIMKKYHKLIFFQSAKFDMEFRHSKIQMCRINLPTNFSNSLLNDLEREIGGLQSTLSDRGSKACFIK